MKHAVEILVVVLLACQIAGAQKVKGRSKAGAFEPTKQVPAVQHDTVPPDIELLEPVKITTRSLTVRPDTTPYTTQSS